MNESLLHVREAIDEVDETIVSALARRNVISKRLFEAGGITDEYKKRIYSRVIEKSPPEQRDLVYNVYERIFAENSGFIEVVVRAVIEFEGKYLFCRAKGGSSLYLPGGHVDFGEKSEDALARELKEETGAFAVNMVFLGVLENSFMQNSKRHCEINLVYKVELADYASIESKEPWLEYEWVNAKDLSEAGILPVEILRFCK